MTLRNNLGQLVTQDSAGNLITIGDRVKFRGEFYTIKDFIPGKGTHGTCQILFTEEQHTPEMADEISVDLVPRGRG